MNKLKIGKSEKPEKTKKLPMDPAKKKKIIRRGIIGAVLAVVLVAVIIIKAAASHKLLPVSTVAAKLGDVEETLSTSGTIGSELSKTYFSPVNATIGSLHAQAGEEVAAGEVILSFDTAQLETETKKALLQAQASENSYKSAMSNSAKNAQKYKEAVNNLGILEAQIAAQKQYVQDLEYGLEDEISAKKSKCTIGARRYSVNWSSSKASLQRWRRAAKIIRKRRKSSPTSVRRLRPTKTPLP